ncbi:MAG: endonuclease/exonuclease/phosphatase family protein [Opitutaceae bacterium]|nr:endonuclease/exonuclease/phosphatase family protein [Opitutaceae bacterium]
MTPPRAAIARNRWRRFACVAALLATSLGAAADDVRVATFNVMNYLCMNRRVDGRFAPGHPKPEVEKASVRAVLHEVNADIVCLQEVGSQPFLDELQQDLAREGLDYPHAVLLDGADPLRHVAVLSRRPPRAVIPHTDLTFPYLEGTGTVKRGVLEVRFESEIGPWSIFVVHLKSPLTEDARDPQSEQRRTAEARAVRDLVLRQCGDGDALYLVAGDLNAAPNSPALAGLTMRGKRRVAEAIPASDSRGETWTHRQLSSDRYDRFDYLLASPALRERVRGGRATIHDGDGALGGSDHRLVWLVLDLAPAAPADSAAAPSTPQETNTPAGAKPAGVTKTSG